MGFYTTFVIIFASVLLLFSLVCNRACIIRCWNNVDWSQLFYGILVIMLILYFL